jgi:hypothetical protein
MGQTFGNDIFNPYKTELAPQNGQEYDPIMVEMIITENKDLKEKLLIGGKTDDHRLRSRENLIK